MNIRVEKKVYESPKMVVVTLTGSSDLLCCSDPVPGSDIDDDDFDGGFGSIGTFGNDKA